MKTTKTTIKIKGMHCPSCEMLIKDILEDEEGVIKADLSHKNGTAIIEFEDQKISIDKIKDIIKKENYEV